MLPIRIRLPGGTLKIKHYQQMRTQERGGWVPVWKIGHTYLILHRKV
jgi:hypothetical protein